MTDRFVFFEKLLLVSIFLFFVLGQFLRLVPLPYFPSNFSLAEGLVYVLTLPIYLFHFRKSHLLIAVILLSTLYGALLSGFEFSAFLYSVKLIAMIGAGVILGETLLKQKNIDYLLLVFSAVLTLGAVIFFVFPKAHLFFLLLNEYGIHFEGDPHLRRFISPFFDPNYYAAIACIPFLIALSRGKKVLASLLALSILLTFSRSGIATLILLLVFHLRKIPLIIMGAAVVMFFFWEELGMRFLEIGQDPSAYARLETFRDGLNLFWDHAFFGLGYHYMGPIFFEEWGRLSPDSSLLITLVDFGLIPTLAFAFYGVFWSLKHFQKKQDPLFRPLYFYLIICIFFTSQFNNLLYYPYWLIPMTALFTYLTRSSERVGKLLSPKGVKIFPQGGPLENGASSEELAEFEEDFHGEKEHFFFDGMNLTTRSKMRTAVVHDWLIEPGGGEKVLDTLIELFPGTLHALFSQKPNVRTTFLQKIPGIQKHYRSFLPLFPLAISTFDLSEYSLILSSSHCLAKSVRVLPHQTHICYCHTPMRYAWEPHLIPMSFPKKILIAPLLSALRSYDKKTSSRVDHFIANSTHVSKRIRRYYNRESTVIHPPVDTHLFSIKEEQDYYFTCSRLVPYKRVDLLIKTFTKLPDKRLLICGDGPQRKSLQVEAPPNVQFLGRLSDSEYRKTLSSAKAFLHAGEEDFGIAMAEAQSAGVPVIAYGVGGARDIVIGGETGLFFREQKSEALLETLTHFERVAFDKEHIRKNAERFGKERFKQEIEKFILSIQEI